MLNACLSFSMPRVFGIYTCINSANFEDVFASNTDIVTTEHVTVSTCRDAHAGRMKWHARTKTCLNTSCNNPPHEASVSHPPPANCERLLHPHALLSKFLSITFDAELLTSGTTVLCCSTKLDLRI